MGHTGTALHMNIHSLHKELDNNQRKCEENNEQKISEYRILGSRSVDKKTKTTTVLLGQDMEESYEHQIGWHTDIHPILSLHMHQDNNSHHPNSPI